MDRLVKEGDNVGTWEERCKSGFYSPEILFEQAEKLRVLAFEKYNIGTTPALKEAFVMMLKFAKFHDLIAASKAVQKGAPAFKKLRRDLVSVITALEQLKPRLTKLLGEAEPPPQQHAEPEAPRDELAVDIAAELEKRWAQFQPAARPKPAPIAPTPPTPGTHLGAAAAAGADAGSLPAPLSESEIAACALARVSSSVATARRTLPSRRLWQQQPQQPQQPTPRPEEHAQSRSVVRRSTIAAHMPASMKPPAIVNASMICASTSVRLAGKRERRPIASIIT